MRIAIQVLKFLSIKEIILDTLRSIIMAWRMYGYKPLMAYNLVKCRKSQGISLGFYVPVLFMSSENLKFHWCFLQLWNIPFKIFPSIQFFFTGLECQDNFQVSNDTQGCIFFSSEFVYLFYRATRCLISYEFQIVNTFLQTCALDVEIVAHTIRFLKLEQNTWLYEKRDVCIQSNKVKLVALQ